MGSLRIELDEASLRIFNSALEELDDIDQRAAVKKAMKSAMDIIVRQGKANLASRNKVRKGNLRKSFGTRFLAKAKKIYGGFKRPIGASAHLVDKGTAERWTRKGEYRGKVRGTFFWTDAVDSKEDEAVDKLMSSIIDEIHKIVN